MSVIPVNRLASPIPVPTSPPPDGSESPNVITLEATMDMVATAAFQQTLQSLRQVAPVHVAIVGQVAAAPVDPTAARPTGSAPNALEDDEGAGRRRGWQRAGCAALLALSLTSSASGLVTARQVAEQVQVAAQAPRALTTAQIKSPYMPVQAAPAEKAGPDAAIAQREQALREQEQALRQQQEALRQQQEALRVQQEEALRNQQEQEALRFQRQQEELRVQRPQEAPALRQEQPVAQPQEAPAPRQEQPVAPPQEASALKPEQLLFLQQEAKTPEQQQERARLLAQLRLEKKEARRRQQEQEQAKEQATLRQLQQQARADTVKRLDSRTQEASVGVVEGAHPRMPARPLPTADTRTAAAPKAIVITDPVWAVHHPITAAVNAHVRAHNMGRKYLMPEVSAVIAPVEALDPASQEAMRSLAVPDARGAAEAAQTGSATAATPAAPAGAAFAPGQNAPMQVASPAQDQALQGASLAAQPLAPTRSSDADARAAAQAQIALKAGAVVPLAGTAFHTLSAMESAHAAAALAASARVSAGAARAAAAARNLPEAARLGALAKAQGAEALATAHSAKAAAHTAGVLSMVSGGIAVVDGAISIHQGIVTKNKVVELHHVADGKLAEIASPDGQISQEVQEDYDAVKARLGGLTRQASRQQVAGGAKALFGGLMIASPATGPAAPIVGAVGAVGYLGTSILEAIFH